jgi:hypothetical protein
MSSSTFHMSESWKAERPEEDAREEGEGEGELEPSGTWR